MTDPATIPPVPLIYLDVDDEITSAAARIRSADAERVAIVLPYGSRLATSRINFRLLAHEAVERGKVIEIVCADASARALAMAAGLPVHPSVAAFEAARAGVPPAGQGNGTGSGGGTSEAGLLTAGVVSGAGAAAAGAAAAIGAAGGAVLPSVEVDAESQTQVLTLPRRSSPRVPAIGPARPPVRTGLAIGVGLGLVTLVAVGSLLAFVVLPSATIVLAPRSEAIGPLSLTVEARTDTQTVDPANLVIPAQRFSFDLAASQTFPATGVKVTETKATGNVTFSNFDTGGSNKIDAGSVVRTDSNVRFETLASVTLPSASIQFPFTIVPSTSTVAVQALEPGEGGNVGNNTIVVVPQGENRRLLQVTNLEATSGGGHSESPQVSQADVDNALTALNVTLATDLDGKVAAAEGVPAGITLFPLTTLVGASTPTVDPATLVGTEGTEFQLGATAQGTVLGVDPKPIAGVAEARLQGRVTDGWSLLPDSIQQQVGTPSVFGDVVSYPVSIDGTQVHDVDRAALIAQIKGHVLAEARSRLDDFGDVDITLWPDWVTSVPTNTDRITFTLADPQPSASP